MAGLVHTVEKTHNMTPEPHVAHSTQYRVQRAAGGGFWSLKLESKKQTSGGFVSSHLTGKNKNTLESQCVADLHLQLRKIHESETPASTEEEDFLFLSTEEKLHILKKTKVAKKRERKKKKQHQNSASNIPSFPEAF